MVPYFIPKELAEYKKRFPYFLNISSMFFPHEKKKNKAYIDLLRRAMKRGRPVLKEELIALFGTEYYQERRFPEKYHGLSHRQNLVMRLFGDHLPLKTLLHRKGLFPFYSRAILDRIYGKVDNFYFWEDYSRQYIYVAWLFPWSKTDEKISYFLVPELIRIKRNATYRPKYFIGYTGFDIKLVDIYISWVCRHRKSLPKSINSKGEEMLPEEILEQVKNYFDDVKHELILKLDNNYCPQTDIVSCLIYRDELLFEIKNLTSFVKNNMELFDKYSDDMPDRFLADLSYFLDEVLRYTERVIMLYHCFGKSDFPDSEKELCVFYRLFSKQVVSDVLLFLDRLYFALNGKGGWHVVLQFGSDELNAIVERMCEKDSKDHTKLMNLAGAFVMGYVFGMD